ncbi:YihY/virulence factor BrkB family protein [Micromonospora sp. KC723]|uniref:YihY/virulence factor BrkB family protein n=1 Tax=Micromonospora sp. KC723 TaxID=2530381 RepID=UPI00104526C4|nr:YhjD/YihY/BrkB family envelope integrity protein [Micromonospora sp. KC723]TDB71841.1 YihY/virulence factor BrkB family protein [Micromonospora sp. KC723]
MWWRARRRHGWLDHLARAALRYAEADGGRLAAAVTYYAFFATFALALLGFALFGFVLDDPAVQRSVQRYLDQNLPNLDVQALRTARGAAGVIAFLGLPVTGWFWVNALRSSIRKVWRLPEYPGTFVVRLLIDLLVLTGLGLLLVVSLATAFTTTALASRLIDTTGADAALTRGLLAVVGLVVGVAVNTLLSIAVLTGLPRLRMPPRRVALPALLVAIGLELLKTVGGFFVQRIEANPTYHVVAGTVGLLVSLSVVNQLVLFAAALTATATIGDVTDLALGGKLPRTSSDQDIATAEPTTVPDTGSAREQIVDHRNPGQGRPA